MKNILIGGTVRAGKSTLANLIQKKYGYSLCESDTIVNAFDKVFPEFGIVHNKPEEAREKYKPFLFEVLNGFCKSLKYHNNVTVFPGSQFLPRHIAVYPKKHEYIVIFLGMSNTTPELLKEKIRSTETTQDWTHKESDERLLKHCEKIIKESENLKTECEKYGFYYFDTHHDRSKILKQIVKLIKIEQKK